MTNAEAWFNIALRPWKPKGLLGRTAQDGHLDSHTAPELCVRSRLRDPDKTDHSICEADVRWNSSAAGHSESTRGISCLVGLPLCAFYMDAKMTEPYAFVCVCGHVCGTFHTRQSTVAQSLNEQRVVDLGRFVCHSNAVCQR